MCAEFSDRWEEMLEFLRLKRLFRGGVFGQMNRFAASAVLGGEGAAEEARVVAPAGADRGLGQRGQMGELRGAEFGAGLAEAGGEVGVDALPVADGIAGKAVVKADAGIGEAVETDELAEEIGELG